MAQDDQRNIIGKGMVVRGSVTGGGDLVIEGQVEGNIDLGSRVAISHSARVFGEIKAPRVVIEDGAIFNGWIQMDVQLPEDL